uniref:Uncharacterized protein n=1 Tax=Clandestinovirus TaxID=2831644 RepID=A0A8F8KTC2_9VIRU|nr:hypothetical protein KOM_12_422 [Clandestinovirus]
MTHFINDPVGASRFKLDVEAQSITRSDCLVTILFPIHKVASQMQQIHRMSVYGPIGLDAIHRCRLVVIPEDENAEMITLGEVRPKDLIKLRSDEIPLQNMWSSPLVISSITSGWTFIILELLRVHPASDWANKMYASVEGAKHTALETAYYSSFADIGPFMIVAYPDPNLYELWYEKGLPVLKLYSEWNKGTLPFDEGDLFDLNQ